MDDKLLSAGSYRRSHVTRGHWAEGKRNKLEAGQSIRRVSAIKSARENLVHSLFLFIGGSVLDVYCVSQYVPRLSGELAVCRYCGHLLLFSVCPSSGPVDRPSVRYYCGHLLLFCVGPTSWPVDRPFLFLCYCGHLLLFSVCLRVLVWNSGQTLPRICLSDSNGTV